MVLGLESTPGSGNQFHSPGDGTTPGHPALHRFPIITDSKYSEAWSTTLRLLTLKQWSVKAAEQGKRFVMPLRFFPRGSRQPSDWVVLSLHDFVELLEMAEARDKR